MPYDQLRMAVRGFIVPDEQALLRRRANRHSRKGRPARAAPAQEEGGSDNDRQAAIGAQERRARPAPPELAELERILGPHPWYTLTFDCETTKDAKLQLRVGYYEVRGISFAQALGRYREGKLTAEDRHRVVEAAFMLPDYQQFPTDHDTVRQYAHVNSWHQGYRTIETVSDRAFVDRLYFWALGLGAWMIGHNVFFDLTRFLTQCGPGAKRYHGGFWLRLCDCPQERCIKHPPIRYKSLGRFKAQYAAWTMTVRDADGTVHKIFRHRLRLVDTITFGFALTHPKSASLRSMGEAFLAREIKEEAPDFDGPITYEYLHYLQQDVRATYWLFVAEREVYARHGINRAVDRLYSEASLGKGYLRELGVPTAKKRPWALPPETQGTALTTYYGGRSEVTIRQTPVEVIYCDFKSQYPTVNTLMGLQAFWIAGDVTTREVTDEVVTLLAQPAPDLLRALQQPATWQRLRVIVKLGLHDDLLPARAKYNKVTYNIGQAHVKSRYQLWYTLADVLASRIRTGKVPTIVQALAFMPSEETVPTTPMALFGRRTVDVQHDDFFREVIDERSDIKRAMNHATSQDEYEQLKAQQTGLKLLANATSYGVFVEINERVYGGRPLPITVYALDATRRLAHVIEEPGPYFMGAMGTLIPAGGRLLLALAEYLAAQRGISPAFCDTDSMAFAQPDSMERAEFHRQVAEVVDYFQPLYPYQDDGRLFEYEDPNFTLDPQDPNKVLDGQHEPLYFLGISAKRYALYNRLENGRYRIRKLSSHGLGMWGRRDQAVNVLPASMPPPHTYTEEKNAEGTVVCCRFTSESLGGPLWVYALWYDVIWTLEHGRYPDGRVLRRSGTRVHYRPPAAPMLQTPAYYTMTIHTWSDYERFRHLPGLVPGNFITVLPPEKPSLVQVRWQGGDVEEERTADDDTSEERSEQFVHEVAATPEARYTGYCATVEDVLRAPIYLVADGHQLPAGTPLTTMAEVVAGYFVHPEEKAANGREAGTVERRYVEVIGVDAIGKESNHLAQASAEETSGVIGGEEMLAGLVYGPTGSIAVSPGRDDTSPRLSSLLVGYAPADLMAATCLSLATVSKARHSTTRLDPESIEALQAGIVLLDLDNPQGIAGWRETLSPDALAKVLGVDEGTGRALHQGRRTWKEEQRTTLQRYLASRQ